jgi:drug/metabolite transporter superfamily protein YnfA
MGVWGLQAPAAGGSFCLSALLLTWPALWNGYPLMFADSGTYVIQVPTLSLGWDRPPFYSLFLLLFHLRLSLWPVVVAQAVAATLLLRLALRTVAPCGSEWRLVGVAGVLAVASSLPWFAAQVMPDLFTGLLVIALALLATRPTWMLAAAATAMITLHLSHLPLAVAVLAGVLAWRWWRERARPGWAVVLPPVLAAGLLLGTNLIGHGRAAIAPFGGVFLLARLIEDGPARAVLARDCDHAGWALCRDRADLPLTADAVLWSPTSPLQAVERAARDQRRVADEADAIVARTWRTEAPAVLAGAGRATLRQLAAFGTGDGLHPWPEAVTPKLARVLPEADLAGYARSRQTLGTLAVPAWLRALHVAAALAGVALCPLLLLLPGVPEAARVLALATLIALPVNAAVTGALSGPHDRYQSRVMWLPLAVAACALPGLWRARRPAAMACA